MFIRDVLGCPNYNSIPPNMVRTYFHPHQGLIVGRSHDHAVSVKLPKQTPPVFPEGVEASETSPRFQPAVLVLIIWKLSSNVLTRLFRIVNSRVTSPSCRRRCRRESEHSWTGCRTIAPSAPSSMWSSELHKHLTFTHHTLLLGAADDLTMPPP